MASNVPVPWKWLESRGPTAFIVGAICFLLYAIPASLGQYTGLEWSIPAWLVDTVLPLGFLLFLIALLGFYPLIRGESPRIAGAGVLFTGIAGLALLVERGAALILSVVEWTVFWEITTGLEPLFLVLAIGTILAAILFGIVSVRTNNPSRLAGVLLLAPAIILLYHLIAVGLNLFDPVWIEFGLMAGAWLVLGILLYTNPTTSSPTATPTPDR